MQVYRYIDKTKDLLRTAKHFSVSPNAVGYENHLYERPDLPTNTVENNLAKIEAAFGRVLENKIKKHKTLIEQDRHVVSQYVGLLQLRTPSYRAHLDDFFQQMEDMGRQIAVAHQNPAAGDRFADKFSNPRKTMFTESMAIGQDVDIWQHLDFCFLEIVKDFMADAEFITSDHPVSLVDFKMSNSFYGLQPWGKTAESVLPLTPKLVLFGNRVGLTGYRSVSDYNVVREINHRTVSGSTQMAITHRPLEDREKDAIISRFPQSLIVSYLDLPDGRADAILKKENK